MITASHSQLMAQYNEWMNSRLYALCATLPDTELHKDRGAFFKSIYATLNHIAYGDLAFLSRFTGSPSVVPGPGADLFGAFGLLMAERAALDQRILAWSASLSPAWLAESLTYLSKIDGKNRTVPKWVLVTHMFNHQTHHRGQVTTLLSQMGLDVGSTDIPFMPQFDADPPPPGWQPTPAIGRPEDPVNKPVMNLDEVKFDDIEENGRYTSSRGRISDHIGARSLGYNLTVLPPGKAQCPFHCHHGEEEMFFILEGEGELRFGDQRYPIRQHDVIACPTGGADVAHQIINTGATPMRYLALSTLVELEICEYPDSQKVLVASGKRGEPGSRKLFRAENTVDYYDRERTDEPP